MSARLALRLNAAIGLASTLAAGAMLSLMMTQPEAVARSVAQREYGTLALALVAQVAGWLHLLVRFL